MCKQQAGDILGSQSQNNGNPLRHVVALRTATHIASNNTIAQRAGAARVSIWVLSTFALLAVMEAQEPILVDLGGAGRRPESQVSADGKYCVVIGWGRSSDASKAGYEMRILDLKTGRVLVNRMLLRPKSATPYNDLGALSSDHRRLLTPDGRFCCTLTDDDSVVLSQVLDGKEVHRVALSELGLTVGDWAGSIWISDKGDFFIAKTHDSANRKSGFRWNRVDFIPTPRVAATTSGQGRKGIGTFPTVFSAGSRTEGRLAAFVHSGKSMRLLLMDTDFTKLSEAPLPGSGGGLTMGGLSCLVLTGTDSNPHLLATNGPAWFVFSVAHNKLDIAVSSMANPAIGNRSLFSGGAISPDGQHLAITREGFTGNQRRSWLSVWSLQQARPIAEVPVESNLYCLRFDTHGKYLSASGGNNVYVWDFAELTRPTADSTPSLSQ